MFELLRQFFINPAALAGMAAVSVPIIIYLINRHKYQRRKWAAMEFLLRAMKRNRRRIQVQNLLLLLLRIAVIVFLVLAMARPVLRRGPLAVAPAENQNWLLAIDTSFSMGFQEGGRSLFDQSRETVSQMLDNVAKAGDRVALMALGKTPRVLLAPTLLGPESRAAFERELEELTLSAEGLDLGASFQAVDELCERFVSDLGDPQAKRIVVFSDFQRSDWLGEDGPRDPTLETTLKKIQEEHGDFALAKVGYSTSPLNLAITALAAHQPLIAPNVWVEFHVRVRNFGREAAEQVDLSIQVDPDPEDGGAEPQLGTVLRVPPGGVASTKLDYRFDEARHHTVVAELRADGLLVDNRRYLVVRVEEEVRVLLVDGEPAADPLERETFHLEVALEPEDDAFGGDGQLTPYRPEYVTFDQLSGLDVSPYAIAVLANVPEVTAQTAEALKRYVAGGGALIVFLGDRVNTELYNELFGKVDEGEERAFLPFRLGDIQGDRRYPVVLEVADASHPVAGYFVEHEDLMNLRLIEFSKYVTTSYAEEPLPYVRVPFRYGDLERNPAVLDNGYGKGRVLWVTSTADLEWNDLGKWADSIVFLYESISYLVRFGLESMNLRVGEAFQQRYEPAAYASEVMLHAPEDPAEEFARVSSIRKDMRQLEGLGEFEITHSQTDLPGLYRLELARPNRPQPDTREYFAVNVDTSESDLTAIGQEDLRSNFPGFEFEVFDATQNLRQVARERGLLQGRELWRTSLIVVLLLLLLETALAYFFGRRVQ